jgi:hypothetical protein
MYVTPAVRMSAFRSPDTSQPRGGLHSNGVLVMIGHRPILTDITDICYLYGADAEPTVSRQSSAVVIWAKSRLPEGSAEPRRMGPSKAPPA